MRIEELFQNALSDWTKRNVDFFGITPRDYENMDAEEVQAALNEDLDNYWNAEKPDQQCEIFTLLPKLVKFSENLISLRLVKNHISGCSELIGDFTYNGKVITSTVYVLPTPHSDLTWEIYGTKYALRIACNRVMYGLNRKGNEVRADNWSYNIDEEEFTVVQTKTSPIKKEKDIFNHLSPRSVNLLEGFYGKELTPENLPEALKTLPEFAPNSVFNFSFTKTETLFQAVRDSKRFANPYTNVQLVIAKLLQYGNEIYNEGNQLILSENALFALENYRTLVYKYQARNKHNKHIPKFSFTDTEPFFDAFKTSQDKHAGRNRMILDNIEMKDGMFHKVNEDGSIDTMVDLYKDPSLQTESLGTISRSLFCNNDAAKRIMMTAKLSTQAVKVKGEVDEFTHRIPARVVFADLEGYSYADSILVSESFAKKLETPLRFEVALSKYDKFAKNIVARFNETGADTIVTMKDQEKLFPGTSPIIMENRRDMRLTKVIDTEKYYYLTVKGAQPFIYGDKLTNLHGSKGVTGKIIPDDQMPVLKNDIGPFKAGPFEVIISGFSVVRRGSLGQIFEAWANAMGVELPQGEDFITKVADSYYDEIEEFSKQSIIELNGVETIKPCGVVDMIRLKHFVSNKSSIAYIKTNALKNLALEEMLKLNMIANETPSLLEELSFRSNHKQGFHPKQIRDLMKTGDMPDNAGNLSLRFGVLARSLGVNIIADGQSISNLEETDFPGDLEVLDNEVVDLSSLSEEPEQ